MQEQDDVARVEDADTEQVLAKELHGKYFARCLNALPSSLATLDAIRLSIAFFAISGMDVLGKLNLIDKSREEIIDWIYRFQITSPSFENNNEACGFRGSLAAVSSLNPPGSPSEHPLDTSHVTMTYAALNTLLILGDDLSRVNKKAVTCGIKALQLPNGSFAGTLQGSESDVRFVYCAAHVSYLLRDWSGIDIDRATDYITSCINYDGAFGQDCNQEGHAGLTYCAVAALSLMGTLDRVLSFQQRRRLERWLVLRQQSGFQGRPNKPVDTCYSFWVAATLRLLNSGSSSGQAEDLRRGKPLLIDSIANRRFVLSTQADIIGGLAKWADHPSDPLHSYLGLAGLSVCQNRPQTGGQLDCSERDPHDGLEPVHPALNVSMRAYRHWQSLDV